MIAVLSPKSKYVLFEKLPSFTCSDKAFTSGWALGCVYGITAHFGVLCIYLNIVFKGIAEKCHLIKTTVKHFYTIILQVFADTDLQIKRFFYSMFLLLYLLFCINSACKY